jgi:hypothetical protein
MLPPAASPGDCCATVRTLLRSPTNDAATLAPEQVPIMRREAVSVYQRREADQLIMNNGKSKTVFVNFSAAC